MVKKTAAIPLLVLGVELGVHVNGDDKFGGQPELVVPDSSDVVHVCLSRPGVVDLQDKESR